MRFKWDPSSVLYAVLLPVIFSGQVVNAAQVHYQFSGVIERYTPEFSSVSSGQEWVAEFVIDSDVVGETYIFPDPAYPEVNSGTSSVYGLLEGSVAIGEIFSWQFTSSGEAYVDDDISITDQNLGLLPTVDSLGFVKGVEAPLYIDGQRLLRLSVSSLSLDLGVINGTDLTEFSQLGAFEQLPTLALRFEDFDGDPNTMSMYILGQATAYNVSVSEVPLPSGIWFLGSALLSLAGLRHR